MNPELSRIGSLVDDDGTTVLAGYTYLGVNKTAQVDFPEPGTRFTWLKQTGDTNPDPYNGWDRFGRAVDLRWMKGSAYVERIQHGYDRASNRLYRRNGVANASKKQDELYDYDGLSQLKEFQRGELNGTNNGMTGTIAAEEDFTFDPTGNWNAYVAQAGGSTMSQTRTHNAANELTQIDSSSTLVAEDAAGNMTKVPKPDNWGAGYDLKYDAWNRLVEVKNIGGSTVATYGYDGLNRRITKTVGSDTRHYYYTDQWQIIEERVNTSTSPDRQFVWGLRYTDDLILRDRGAERLYVVQDFFQPTAVTDDAGVVLERYGYEAYGTTRVMDANFDTQTAGSSYEWETRFGAYRWDSETKLYQVRNRYLHPKLGRWITRDPASNAHDVNLYFYSLNSPVNTVDPNGLCPAGWALVGNMTRTINTNLGIVRGQIEITVVLRVVLTACPCTESLTSQPKVCEIDLDRVSHFTRELCRNSTTGDTQVFENTTFTDTPVGSPRNCQNSAIGLPFYTGPCGGAPVLV